MKMNCSTVREDLEAYAIGALGPEDATNLQHHLSGCPECAELLVQYQETLALLPAALAATALAASVPVDLPGSLKGRLLQAIEAEEIVHNPVQPPSSQLSSPQPPSPQPVPEGLLSRVWRRLAGGRRSLLRTYPLPAAMVLLLVAVFAWSITLNVTLARERSLRAEFASLVDQQELVLEVVDSNKTTRRVLLPPENGPPSYGKIFTRSDMAHVVAMAARLTPPVPGDAYHLWVVKGTETTLAGLLTTNDDGFGLLLYDDSEVGPFFAEALLTLQPIGSTAPSLPPILTWRASP